MRNGYFHENMKSTKWTDIFSIGLIDFILLWHRWKNVKNQNNKNCLIELSQKFVGNRVNIWHKSRTILLKLLKDLCCIILIFIWLIYKLETLVPTIGLEPIMLLIYLSQKYASHLIVTIYILQIHLSLLV